MGDGEVTQTVLGYYAAFLRDSRLLPTTKTRSACLLLPAAIPQLRKPVHQIRLKQLLQLIIISPIKQEHILNLQQTHKTIQTRGLITEITLNFKNRASYI
jgi:hypothetical protein